MKGRKNMNLGLIYNLSLADWESEARVKHFWGHRECFSIPSKDHRSKRLVNKLIYHAYHKLWYLDIQHMGVQWKCRIPICPVSKSFSQQLKEKNNSLFHTLRDRMLNQCPSWEHDITRRLL
jgi:hypothetical protein